MRSLVGYGNVFHVRGWWDAEEAVVSTWEEC